MTTPIDSFLNNSTISVSINDLLKETEVSNLSAFPSSFTRKELNTSTPSIVMAFRALQLKAKELERINYQLREEKFDLLNKLKENTKNVNEISRLSNLYNLNKDEAQERIDLEEEVKIEEKREEDDNINKLKSNESFTSTSSLNSASFLTSASRNAFLYETKEIELNIEELNRRINKLETVITNDENLNFTLRHRNNALEKIHTDLENDILNLTNNKKKYEEYYNEKLNKISELKNNIQNYQLNNSYSLQLPSSPSSIPIKDSKLNESILPNYPSSSPTASYFPVYNSDLSLAMSEPSSPHIGGGTEEKEGDKEKEKLQFLISKIKSLKIEEEKLTINIDELNKIILNSKNLYKLKNLLINFINKLNFLLLKYIEEDDKNEKDESYYQFLLNKSVLLTNTIKNCHSFNDLLLSNKFYKLFLASNSLTYSPSSPIASFTLPTSSSLLKKKNKIETSSVSPSIVPSTTSPRSSSLSPRTSSLSPRYPRPSSTPSFFRQSSPRPQSISPRGSLPTSTSHHPISKPSIRIPTTSSSLPAPLSSTSQYPPAPPTFSNSISIPSSYYPENSTNSSLRIKTSPLNSPNSAPYTSTDSSSVSPSPFIPTSHPSSMNYPDLSNFTLDLSPKTKDIKKKKVKTKTKTSSSVNSSSSLYNKSIGNIRQKSLNSSMSYTDLISTLPQNLSIAAEIINKKKKSKSKIKKNKSKKVSTNLNSSSSSLNNLSNLLSSINNTSNLSFSSSLSNLAENRSILRNTSRVSLNDLAKAATEASRSLLFPIPSPASESPEEDYNIHNVEFIPSSVTEGTEFNIIATMSKATRATKQLNAALQSK